MAFLKVLARFSVLISFTCRPSCVSAPTKLFSLAEKGVGLGLWVSFLRVRFLTVSPLNFLAPRTEKEFCFSGDVAALNPTVLVPSLDNCDAITFSSTTSTLPLSACSTSTSSLFSSSSFSSSSSVGETLSDSLQPVTN